MKQRRGSCLDQCGGQGRLSAGRWGAGVGGYFRYQQLQEQNLGGKEHVMVEPGCFPVMTCYWNPD